MKKLNTLLMTLSFAALTASSASAQTLKHTIKKGESLYTIAHNNHTTVEALQKTNNMKKGEVLKLGRVLTLPSSSSSARQAKISKPQNHKVKSGDVLGSIARKYDTNVKTLKSLNGLRSNALKVGQILKVPSAKTSYVAQAKLKNTLSQKISKPQNHKVKSGDVLGSIARKYDTNVKTLKSLNGLRSNALKVGQVLKVPSAKTSYVAKANRVKTTTKLAKSISRLPNATLSKSQHSKNEIFTIDNTSFSGKPEKIINVAKTKLGQRYVWGATGKKGTFDCSGFTRFVYQKNGIALPRTSINQSKHGKFVPRGNLKKGDLIFFDTSRRGKGYVNHVGIYMGNDKFIHASSAKRKVVITNLSKSFYSKRYKGARRPL